MNPDVVYAKTAKGIAEVSQRTHRLPARIRTLLIMIDGKVSAGDLLRRSGSPDEAAVNLANLLSDGFIEPKAVGPSQAAVPGAPPVAEDRLFQARSFMVKSMVAALGPDAIHFTSRIEAAPDLAALAELAERYVEVVRTGGGGRKADAFRAGLIELGVLATTPERSGGMTQAPTAHADEVRRLARTKSAITRFLLDTLGPDANQFTGKIETASSTDELKRLAARHLELLRVTVGPRKAEEFRVLVGNALNG